MHSKHTLKVERLSSESGLRLVNLEGSMRLLQMMAASQLVIGTYVFGKFLRTALDPQ